MKTESFNPDTIERQWHLVDLDGQTLGRAAARIAQVLRGKHKPTFTPHADCGDFVVVVNADRLVLTGAKLTKKVYYRHTGYMGGLKESTAGEMMAKDSCLVVEKAIKGMLPRGPLGRHMLTKLKVYAGGDHPHAAQKPAPIDLQRV
ncbi:MAG: 50S ribosomal protein L13 [Deltaproteobacteria bacterium HGW-Deltaproteobacteria-14]|jgi:large subunit ribosomal protein L13|nr:MAG: 50S ribosomal protein L13 [Deltaproteobacteria bacterium HGW-Deltaproteobacteria-14]